MVRTSARVGRKSKIRMLSWYGPSLSPRRGFHPEPSYGDPTLGRPMEGRGVGVEGRQRPAGVVVRPQLTTIGGEDLVPEPGGPSAARREVEHDN